METSNTKTVTKKTSKAVSLGRSFKKIQNVRNEISAISQKIDSLSNNMLFPCMPCMGFSDNKFEETFSKAFGFGIPVGDRAYIMEMKHYLYDIEHVISEMKFDITGGYYKRITGRNYRGKRNDFPEMEYICKISDNELFPSYAKTHREEIELKETARKPFGAEYTKYTKPFKKYSDCFSILLNYYDEEIIPNMKQVSDDFKNLLEDENVKDFLMSGSHSMNGCRNFEFAYENEIGYIQSISFIQVFNMIGMEEHSLKEKQEYLLGRFYSKDFSDKLNDMADNSEIMKKEIDFCIDILTKDIHEFPFLFDSTSEGLRVEKQLSAYGVWK